ncbi:MAG: diguanylate cyclase, partial [Candidatus Gracilibacteria bacterium]|nr:diguanylate cyclase [Candidatus Gracilibacteria bacterium]
MGPEKNKKKDIKLQFYAIKLYLSKLAEKYKNRQYEKVFLEKDFNFLEDIKEITKNIKTQNHTLDEIITSMTKSIQRMTFLEKVDPVIKRILVEDTLLFFSKFMSFVEDIIKNEDRVMEAVDRFRKIEQEIDIKSRSLTRYGFDKELASTLENLKIGEHKELSLVIFDMNNLKTLNETYGHQTGAESILKFGKILKEELKTLGTRYLLSNYFGGDEWFLCLIDVNKKNSVNFVKKVFEELHTNTYEIGDFNVQLSACAGITHYHPAKNTEHNIGPKTLVNITDILVLRAKVRKNRSESGNAYNVLNVSSCTVENIATLTKSIQTLPKDLNTKTLNKKKLVELFDIREKQNEKIMRARTLGEKKILGNNINILSKIISRKMIESITKTLSESKNNTIEKISHISKKAIRMAIRELMKNTQGLELDQDEREKFAEKIVKSPEFNNYY